MNHYQFPNEPPEAVKAWFAAKGLKPSFNWADVWQYEHQVSFTVAKAMQLDILQDLRDAVARAINNGQTLQQFRKALTPLLQKKGWWGIKDMTDRRHKPCADWSRKSPAAVGGCPAGR